MRISVAMCTFNGARYLEEQLRSIAGQTRAPDELVICDDRSTDDSTAVIARFAASAPFPVRLKVNAARLGSTPNFQQAMTLASGELIALSDQDDIWFPDKLAEAEREFQASPNLMARFTDAELADADGGPLTTRLWPTVGFDLGMQRALGQGSADRLFFRQSFVTGATLVIRRSFLDRACPIPTVSPLFIHDRWLALCALASGGLHASPSVSMLYRQHDAQQIGAARSRSGRNGLQRRITSTAENIRQERSLLESLHAAVAPGARPHFMTELDARILHLQRREELLSRPRVIRAPQVLGELTSGRYHSQASGLLSAAKDLLLR